MSKPLYGNTAPLKQEPAFIWKYSPINTRAFIYGNAAPVKTLYGSRAPLKTLYDNTAPLKHDG